MFCLKPRERVKRVINLDEPDRVPIDIGSTACNFTNNIYFKLKEVLGIKSQDILLRPDESSSYYNDEILEKLDTDFRHVFLLPPDNYNFSTEEKDIIISEWGIKKEKLAD